MKTTVRAMDDVGNKYDIVVNETAGVVLPAVGDTVVYRTGMEVGIVTSREFHYEEAAKPDMPTTLFVVLHLKKAE